MKHHRLKHGNDMHVKPDSGMHGKSDNDKHAEPDNDMHVEPCNDKCVGSDDDKHGEPGNDARTRFQGAASTDQIGPELYRRYELNIGTPPLVALSWVGRQWS